jgi:hypothetical protein
MVSQYHILIIDAVMANLELTATFDLDSDDQDSLMTRFWVSKVEKCESDPKPTAYEAFVG